MNNLKEIGVGYDYVKSFSLNAPFASIEAWLQFDQSTVPALAMAFFAAVLISNRISQSKRR